MDTKDATSVDIDVATVKMMLDRDDDFLLLDCRTPEEHEIASIKQAKLLPMDELEARLGELQSHRSKRIVVHCHLGGRSLMVTQWLRQQGFSKTQNMEGGIDAWSQRIDSSIPRYE